MAINVLMQYLILFLFIFITKKKIAATRSALSRLRDKLTSNQEFVGHSIGEQWIKYSTHRHEALPPANGYRFNYNSVAFNKAMTYERFIELFPIFEDSIDEDIVLNYIANVEIETNGYLGIESEGIREMAIALHVAFLLENNYPKSATGINGVIKRMENFNDEVEFAVSPTDTTGFDANQYGQRLKRLLCANYMGGLYV